MGAILTQVRASILRRRAQTATILLICMLAGSVSAMALTLLVRSTEPWDDAFAKVEGPHLLYRFDASRVTAEQLDATRRLPGVTAAGPARPTALVPFGRGDQKGRVQLIGRDDPGGPLDRLLVSAGRWPVRSGEIAVHRTRDTSIAFRPALGDTVKALTAAGPRDFKVVGEVIDVSGHGLELDYTNGFPAAWVVPSEIPNLVDGREVRPGYEMAYRFARAGTAEEIAADRRTVEAALPAGSQTVPATDWLQARRGSIWFIDMLSSIIWSFTVFALLAVGLIVASVVAGSVLSGYRDIGITKALGFTPLQVLAVQVGQMAVPALAGAALGVPLGVLACQPVLADAAHSLLLPPPSVVDPLVDLGVPLGVLVVVLVAAVLPALRGAAVNSIRAITLGAAPSHARRSRLSAGLVRLGAPRSLTLGAGEAFARPVRALLTLVALAVGIATVTFAIGFQNTLVTLVTEHPAVYGYGQDLTVQRYPGVEDATLMGRLAADPDTDRVVATRMLTIRVRGEADPEVAVAMRGDALRFGYQAAEGRWFAGPGEAVIGLAVARAAHLRVGDEFDGTIVGGGPVRLRAVGILNDFNSNGHAIRFGWDTLASATTGSEPDQYLVQLRRGADARAFAKRLNAAYPDYVEARVTDFTEVSQYSGLISWMVGILALVLLLIAAAGVFNATLLSTRERMHDIAILKSLGMTGRQVALMATASVLVLALFAILIGVPVGVWLQGFFWGAMGDSMGVIINPSGGVDPGPLLLALVVAILIALAGAALPARWAAATPVAQVLRSE